MCVTSPLSTCIVPQCLVVGTFLQLQVGYGDNMLELSGACIQVPHSILFMHSLAVIAQCAVTFTLNLLPSVGRQYLSTIIIFAFNWRVQRSLTLLLNVTALSGMLPGTICRKG